MALYSRHLHNLEPDLRKVIYDSFAFTHYPVYSTVSFVHINIFTGRKLVNQLLMPHIYTLL